MSVPQADEDLEYGRKDLADGFRTGVCEVVEEDKAQEFVRRGHLIS